jgi:hypothetical protein
MIEMNTKHWALALSLIAATISNAARAEVFAEDLLPHGPQRQAVDVGQQSPAAFNPGSPHVGGGGAGGDAGRSVFGRREKPASSFPRGLESFDPAHTERTVVARPAL